MSTLDYILGDPMQKKAEMDAEQARLKAEYELNEKKTKERNKFIKDRDMAAMKKKAIQARNQQKATTGAISTLMFMQFAV